jgi:hypothetical protein
MASWGELEAAQPRFAASARALLDALFRVELEPVSLVSLNEARDRLVIEWWRPGEPVQRLERE